MVVLLHSNSQDDAEFGFDSSNHPRLAAGFYHGSSGSTIGRVTPIRGSSWSLDRRARVRPFAFISRPSPLRVRSITPTALARRITRLIPMRLAHWR
jgi:hypothetical protein